MSGQTAVAAGGDLRARILQDPEIVLGDPLVMRALMARSDGAMGANVVDLRSVAITRLEGRLGQLEAAHRTVIAAAYENLAGTQQIHRAILHLLEATEPGAFAEGLSGEVAAILRVHAVRLAIEAPGVPWPRDDVALPRPVLQAVPPGYAAALAGDPGDHAADEPVGEGAAPRVVLRRGARLLLAEAAAEGGAETGSEAAMTLDLGRGRCGVLGLWTHDPNQFAPGQGTDLLGFLGGVVERAMRRWID